MGVKRCGEKVFIFILFVCVFSFLAYTFLKPEPLFNCDSGVYTFYLCSPSSNAKIVTVNSVEASQSVKTLQNIKGEGLFLDYQLNGKQNCLKLIFNEIESKNAHLVFCESGDWGECYYYYTERIADFCVINGERVNIHVAIGKNGASIGSPLIFGSF